MAQYSTAQNRTAQHSTAQHSTVFVTQHNSTDSLTSVAYPGAVAVVGHPARRVRPYLVSARFPAHLLLGDGVRPAVLVGPLHLHVVRDADDAEALLSGPEAVADVAVRRLVLHRGPLGDEGAHGDEDDGDDEDDDGAAGGDDFLLPAGHHDSYVTTVVWVTHTHHPFFSLLFLLSTSLSLSLCE